MTREEALKHQCNGDYVWYGHQKCYISQLSYPASKNHWAYVIAHDSSWGKKVQLDEIDFYL